jgi:transcriptional regulator with XRE-family HTH domain
MTRQSASPDSLRVRLGAALQRERQRRGLSQSQLGKLTKLSLTYVGEIERGDANVTIGMVERLAAVLDWNPFELSVREQDTLPEGVRTLLVANLNHIQQLAQTALGWLQTFETALARRAAQEPDTDAPIRRRGRPRKPKPPPVDPD